MNLVANVICWWLLAQASGGDRAPGDLGAFQPRAVPKRAAQATPIEIGDGGGEPAAHGSDAAPGQHQKEAGGDIPDNHPAGPSDPAGGMSPVDRPHQKLRPPELLAEALTTPREGAVIGKPLTLLTALSRTADRQQQLKITQSYWRLSTAQADYHWALDQRDKLRHYTEKHTNSPGALSARASARADVRDMQLVVTQAQQELLDLLGAQNEEEPPLAVDRPHVGGYNTGYEQVFTNRIPPPRIRLIHRTLPVLRKAIDDHGDAITETLDALESTGEDFQRSGQGLTTVLATLDQLKQERRAFMADVRDYNQQIAEYACTVLPPGANHVTLVSKLIKTAPRTNPAPARGRAEPRNGDSAVTDPAAEAEQPAVDDAGAAQDRTANYQAAEGAGSPDEGVYAGLMAVESAERVQKLADWLHWDRNLPPDAGEGMSLGDCLRPLTADQRLNVIAHYWRTRERLASYQALYEQWEQINALRSIAIKLRDQPGMTGANVRLQAARRSAHAAILDSHVALLGAEFELTLAAGRRVDDPWLLPSTLPQSGGYRVETTRASRDARYWGGAVRLAHQTLEDGAEAVVQADADRAVLINETRQGAQPEGASHEAAADEPVRLDGALRAIAHQNDQTLAMLRGLTFYNMAIARYVIAALPSSISSDELVKRLVIERSSKNET